MLLTAIVFILVLSILIFVHESGHFIMAKKLGMYVEEFGFGLPPRIWGKKIGETIYSINWLPIGGFVKLHGEDEEVNKNGDEVRNEDPNLSRAFFNRPKWQRILVLISGVTMNFLLAVAVISFIFNRGVLVPSDKVRIDIVLPNSPAAISGLKEGDVINTVKGKQVKKSEEVIQITKQNLGKPVRLGIIRPKPNGLIELMVIIVTPRETYPKDQGPLGIAISNLEEKKYPWYQAPYYGLKETLVLTWVMLQGLWTVLYRLISFAEIPKDVAGPLGIAQLTGQAIRVGWMAVLQLLGLLSLNLAIINILPIPALDGGRLAFVFLEKIIGKKLRARIEATTHQIGILFLLSLFVLITIHDGMRIFGSLKWGEQLKAIFKFF